MELNILRLIIFFLFFGGVSTPVAQPANEQSPAAEPGRAPAPLLAAMHYVPAATETLAFTDWAVLKTALDAEGITGASHEDVKLDFLRDATMDLATASGFGLAHLDTMHELWGWDTTDLEWEATLTGGPPVYVLKLREDFPVDDLVALFERRGFARAQQGEAVVLTHRLDLSVDWLTEPALFNAAIFPADHVLIHASSPDAVAAAVAAFDGSAPSWAAAAGYATLAERLAGSVSALAGSGSVMCMPFDPDGLPRDTGDEALSALAAALEQGAGVQPFAAMAVAYRLGEEGQPHGQILFQYAEPSAAENDLAPRRLLAESGVSLVTGKPYAATLFTVTDAGVDDDTLAMTVEPVDGKARRLFDMVYRRDLLFAVCP